VSKWDRADHFSDRIVDLLNEERKKPDFSPTQTLAGLMLGMCAFARTCRKEDAPQPYIDVMDAIRRCLNSMMTDEEMTDAV
jgi:hypothetical protein